MPNQLSLKNKLKVYRAEHHLTQEALAIEVGVTRKTINFIEAGNYSPSIVLALQIAQVFKVPVENIFYLQDQQ